MLGFQRMLTTVIVAGPFLTLCFVVTRISDTGVALWSVLLAGVLYFVVGYGVTVGFHRLFTHKSFQATRPLKIALAALGSMSFQGSIIGWVADHRRHHQFTDSPGDPHSPAQGNTARFGRFAGSGTRTSAGSSGTRALLGSSMRRTCWPTPTSS